MNRVPVIPLFFALWLSACALRPPPQDAPSSPAAEGHLAVRLKAQWQGDGRRQYGRASWRSGGDRGKLLLFDPLNRPLLEVQSRGEEVLLLDRRRNRSWSGPFREMMVRLWGIDVTLAQLREIVEEGRTPAGLTGRNDLRLAIKRRAGKLRSAVFTTSDARLRLQVNGRERLPGDVVFVPAAAGTTEASLAELLDHG